MNYEEAKAIRDRIEAELTDSSVTLRAIPGYGTGSAFGLTPDSVKATVDYQVANAINNAAFRKLQDFNAVFVRHFHDEILNERRTRIAKMSA